MHGWCLMLSWLMSSEDLALPSVLSMTHYSSILELSFKENDHKYFNQFVKFPGSKRFDGWWMEVLSSSLVMLSHFVELLLLYVFYVTKKGIANTLFVEKNKIKFWLSSVSRMVLRQWRITVPKVKLAYRLYSRF